MHTSLQNSEARGAGPVLQAELQLEVAPFLAFAHAVVGAGALLLDILQLFARCVAV